jgi:hypothetical protein
VGTSVAIIAGNDDRTLDMALADSPCGSGATCHTYNLPVDRPVDSRKLHEFWCYPRWVDFGTGDPYQAAPIMTFQCLSDI